VLNFDDERLSMTSQAVLLISVMSNLPSHSADCADITIICPGAYVDVLTEVSPRFERTTKPRSLSYETDPAISLMRAGEVFAVVILPDDAIYELIRRGLRS
jgi:ABC-type molybdate transport system substrate-binding protein